MKTVSVTAEDITGIITIGIAYQIVAELIDELDYLVDQFDIPYTKVLRDELDILLYPKK